MPSPLPHPSLLNAGLAEIFGGDTAVVHRETNVHSSTFPSEFLTCRLPDGRTLELFCKYGEDDSDGCFGHRGSTRYEAAVYRELLTPLAVEAPRFVGEYAEPGAGRTWLILQRLIDAYRPTEAPDPAAAMRQAAQWLGRFHSRAAGALPASNLLIRHDERYYAGWIDRTICFAAPLAAQYPWLANLRGGEAELIDPLIETPALFIHGELYPHNLLIDHHAVFAIDWQSAALGAGELDLAALIERWADEIAQDCRQQYMRSRWPSGPPAQWDRTLLAARAHWLFRWLGDRPQWTLAPRSTWRFEQLRVALEQLGVL